MRRTLSILATLGLLAPAGLVLPATAFAAETTSFDGCQIVFVHEGAGMVSVAAADGDSVGDLPMIDGRTALNDDFGLQLEAGTYVATYDDGAVETVTAADPVCPEPAGEDYDAIALADSMFSVLCTAEVRHAGGQIVEITGGPRGDFWVAFDIQPDRPDVIGGEDGLLLLEPGEYTATWDDGTAVPLSVPNDASCETLWWDGFTAEADAEADATPAAPVAADEAEDGDVVYELPDVRPEYLDWMIASA